MFAREMQCLVLSSVSSCSCKPFGCHQKSGTPSCSAFTGLYMLSVHVKMNRAFDGVRHDRVSVLSCVV